MRNVGLPHYVAFGLIALLGVTGCSSADGGDGGGDQEEEALPKPSFPEGTGQPANNEIAYAAGPYGISKGSVIANYQFVGFVNASADNTTTQLIQMADFYNPTGNEVYPEGSPYGAGKPKPKALLIDVASSWCGPCQHEADVVLPAKYAEYAPMGGEFLLQLADGPTPGKAATTKNLISWTTKYDVNYPAAYDPAYKLSALFDADAFPANMIIKTQTMEIMAVISGVPDDAFWAKFEKVMAGEL
jgi:thiol-disulfide isomerase/thioredoxin